MIPGNAAKVREISLRWDEYVSKAQECCKLTPRCTPWRKDPLARCLCVSPLQRSLLLDLTPDVHPTQSVADSNVSISGVYH